MDNIYYNKKGNFQDLLNEMKKNKHIFSQNFKNFITYYKNFHSKNMKPFLLKTYYGDSVLFEGLSNEQTKATFEEIADNFILGEYLNYKKGV